MSKIGNQPIPITSGVTVTVTDNRVKVVGPRGTLVCGLRPEVTVAVSPTRIIVERAKDTSKAKSLHGLYRTILANSVFGVTQGWNKGLELVGVGFKAQTDGANLTLNVGYSHPVNFAAPAGITFEVKDGIKINVSGADKQLVGEVAAQIRRVRPPEPYKGKGIRYIGEKVRRKAGKAAAKPTGPVK